MKASMPPFKIIDLTHNITPTMPVHPYDNPISLKKTRSLEYDHYNDWTLCSGMHVGTHIDGPGHLTNSPILLSDLPADRFVGRGVLIDARPKTQDLTGEQNLTLKIDTALLENIPNEEPPIVLIMTEWYKKYHSPDYFNAHPIISPETARKFVEKGIKMIGIDFFSPDYYPFEVHQILLEAGILIIENLKNLEQLIGITNFTIIALPLKTETDSSLARVIALQTTP